MIRVIGPITITARQVHEECTNPFGYSIFWPVGDEGTMDQTKLDPKATDGSLQTITETETTDVRTVLAGFRYCPVCGKSLKPGFLARMFRAIFRRNP